jgi:hypothetical protein
LTLEFGLHGGDDRRKTGDGGEEEVFGEYSYNGSVANKALELLGKQLGMFIDRKEVGGPNEFERTQGAPRGAD